MSVTTPTRSTIVPIPDEDALPWRGFDSASLRLAAGAPTAALSAYISCSICNTLSVSQLDPSTIILVAGAVGAYQAISQRFPNDDFLKIKELFFQTAVTGFGLGIIPYLSQISSNGFVS